MTEPQIQEALGSITPEYPAWKAFVELMQRSVDDNVEQASRMGLEDNIRQFNAGRLYQALSFRNELHELMAAVQARAGAVARTSET